MTHSSDDPLLGGFGLAPLKAEGVVIPCDELTTGPVQNPPDKSIFYLPSGKSFYANLGIVGIDGELFISEGYDGGVDIDDYELSSHDLRDLADIMIDRWTRYKKSLT